MNLTLARFCLLMMLSLSLTAHAESTEEALPTSAIHALDAMAPAGHWAARLTLLRNGYGHRFDNAGKRVDFDTDANLALAPFGVSVDSDITTEFVELMFGYGVTENLTVGAILPYARTTSRLQLNGSTPGINVLQGTLAGLGYPPLSSTSVTGFSDPTFGALWRFHKSPTDSAVFGAGVRVGVAKPDDPDNLADIPPGDGSTDLRFRVEYFRDLGSGWDLRLLGEHQVQLPDEVVMRPGGPFRDRKSVV